MLAIYLSMLTAPDEKVRLSVIYDQMKGSSTGTNMEWRPTYLPEGFSESSSYVWGEGETVMYTNSEGETILFNLMSSQTSAEIDNQYSDYDSVLIGAVDYHIYSSSTEDHFSTVVWEFDNTAFSIQSSVNTAELLKIAASVSK